MIQELFTRELFIPSLAATTKQEAIEEMVAKLDQAGLLNDKITYLQAVLHREAEYSTGIGMGVAIPHGKSGGVTTPGLVFARSQAGVDFDSMDDLPTFLFFLIAVPEESADTHLKVLSSLSRKLMHQDVRDALMKADSYDAIIQILE
jgi:PTS system nitrogen regulatory IIA component